MRNADMRRSGMNEKNSYDYVADAVRTYWNNTFPRDVVAFFRQKYSFNDKWEYLEEVVFCKSDSDYETVTFLNDFCEGQTCVENIIIVPLCEVLEYYGENALVKDGEVG